MKREAKLLLDHALDGIVLAIEHFNRPYERGRTESVSVQLNRSFEMLMKAAIILRGGCIWKKKEGKTFGFDHCVNLCLTDPKTRFLGGNQVTTLRLVNGLRDLGGLERRVHGEDEGEALREAGPHLVQGEDPVV